MGLIKALKDAAGTVMADQWLEYFVCDALTSDQLMVQGQKKFTDGRNSNTKGSDNVISSGSAIVVNPGQCMIIVDQGKIADLCAEPGEFIYDASTEPSIFAGSLGKNIVNSFKTFGRRFAFGGNTAKDQRVYYINTKINMNNLYGTATPIDFHLYSPHTGYHLDTTVKCNGDYSFVISDPVLFFTKVAGNVDGEYTKSGRGAELMAHMKRDLLNCLPVALSKVAAKNVLPYQLQEHNIEITQYLNEALAADWAETGIEIEKININAVIPPEDREKINRWNDTVMLRTGDMQEAAKTEAMTAFVKNSSLGGAAGEGGASSMDAMMGMMAMNMMQQNMSAMSNPMSMQQGQPMMQQSQPMMQQPQMQPAGAAILGWTCSCGKADNRGKFCQECGSPKPAAAGWTCSCGHVNQGKFCQECGQKKPTGAPLYKCDKCGYEPEDPTNVPKFCPECGDVFDENDVK